MSRSTDDEKVVQEGLHLTQSDGTLSKRFNAMTGKWDLEPNKQSLAFDPTTGRLLVKRTNAPVNSVDSGIALNLA